MVSTRKVAVVTGANRGIGFETCRQLAKHGMKVVLAARDEAKGRAAAERLRNEDLDVDFAPLDVSDDGSVQGFARHIKKSFGRVDVLVNNAGIMIDGNEEVGSGASGVMQAKIETLRRTMEVNVYGALRVTQALLPLMPKEGARIINVSSGMGQLAEMNGGWPGYRISKTGLNALTRIFADELWNFADGRRTLGEIAEAVTFEFGFTVGEEHFLTMARGLERTGLFALIE